MKKNVFSIFLLASLLAGGAYASEGDADKSVGLSFGASFCKTNFTMGSADGDKDSEVKGVSLDIATLDMRYVNNGNNIAVLAGFGSGILFSPKVAVGSESVSDALDGSTGTYMNLFAGIGYKFKLSERFSITPGIVVGFEYTSIDERRKDDDYKGVEAKFFEEQIGADIHADFLINEKWSVFLAATGKFKFMGWYRYNKYTENSYDFESTYQKGDTDLGFSISPKIGLSYHY